jgi:hypothetical protein
MTTYRQFLDLAAALDAWRVAHLELSRANQCMQDARKAHADASEAARNARDRVEGLLARQKETTP